MRINPFRMIERAVRLLARRLAGARADLLLLSLCGFLLFVVAGHAGAAVTFNSTTLDVADPVQSGAVVYVKPNGEVTATVNATVTGGGTRWRTTSFQFGTRPAFCVNAPNATPNSTSTVTGVGNAPSAEGGYNVIFRIYDGANCGGSLLDASTLTGGIVVDGTPPVATISCGSPAACGNTNPTSALQVTWNISFSEIVTGLDVSNFSLSGTGAQGATITSVAGSGTSWTVTAASGANGVLTLNLDSNLANIRDRAGNNPAAVAGNANNSYTVSIPPRNCTSRASGNWSSSTTWTSCGNSIPRSGDTVTIGHAVTLDVNTASVAAIMINSGGSLTNNSSWAVTVSGNFSNAGTYTGGSGTVSIGGNFANTGTFNAGTSTWTFNGGSAQSITGAVTFSRLTIDNAAGVTASGNLTVSGALALSTGIVSMGSNTLAVDANCTTALSQTAGFVDGRLRLQFPSGSNVTCTYHVGSGGFYAPATVVVSSSGGRLTGSTTSGDHPNIASSGLNASKSVNRYWTLWRSGDTIASVSSYAVTLNFQASDLDSGAAWGNLIIARYVGGNWSKPGSVTAYPTATAASSLTGLNSTNDFAIGEDSDPCPVPAGFASCVCDNFGRATLNPSTIYNGDWIVSHSGDNPFEPITFNGALRLTDNSNNVAAAATVPGTFPAAGNNITVEFKHYAYQGTNPGADGIALTLSDSSVPAIAGAFGGSLGYAQKTGINGFGGGWLGVGIDEYGNYPNPTEGRVGGPGFIPQTVTLRGSGSGAGAAATNYPFIATSGALNPVIDNPASTTPSRGHLYRITVDARNYTWNGSSGNKSALVLVERDTTGTGNSYVALPNLNLTNIYDYNTGQANVPNNWKLSFTGATGGNTNIHEIKALKVCSTFFIPPGSFDIQANTTSGLTCATPGGNPSSPIITIRARNNQGMVDTSYAGTVTLNAKTAAGALSGTAVWRKVGTGANIVNGGSYTFTPGDSGAAQFYLTDTAAENLTITIADSSTSTTSPTPISFSSTATSYIIEDAEPSIGAVAGRPHLMKVTYYSGCGATNVAGSKNMSGWYVRDASDPNGVAPRMCPAPSGAPTSCLPDGSPQTCANPQLSTAPPGSSNLSLNFNGNSYAYFCLKTSDVGKYYPQLRETADPSAITSSAPLMTFRPFAVAVSGIKQGTTGNPAPAGSSAATVANGGARFVSAGTNFEATVGGYLWNAAGDLNFDGIPDANASFAALTGGNLASHYADAVVLSAGSVAPPANLTKFNGGTVNVTGGSGTQLSLAYNEVGAITLAATPSANYLSSGINLSNRVAIFSNPSSAAKNSVIGRFFPHHFSVIPASFAHGCPAGNFTYEGQPFNLGFKIEARNVNDALTSNYSAGVGYGPLASGTLSLVAENANDGVDRNSPNRVTPALAGLSWTGGSFTYSGAHALTRLAAEGPFQNLDIGLKIADNSGDGVPLGNGDMNALTTGACSGTGCTAVKLGTTAMRYGRLRIDNAYGSELLPLNVRVEAQYWNSATGAYVRNTDDNCSSLAASNFDSPPAQYVAGAAIATSVLGGGTLSSGTGFVRLSKPSSVTPANRKGSVRLQTKSPLNDYLPGSGIETFGIYKSGPVIYLREIFQ